MKNTAFDVLNSKNLERSLGRDWVASLNESDFEIDRGFYALFIDDDIVRDRLGMDDDDPVTDVDREMCADVLTYSNAASILDYEALGCALLDDPHIMWDEIGGLLALVA